MTDTSSRYPIGAVARLTGITVDTLRIWERRYAVVTPERDERGRMYSEADVRRLQLLAATVARGHPIGRLARRTDAELQDLLSALPAPAASRSAASEPAASATGATASLMAALRGYDAVAVDRELGRLALAMPPRDLVHRVVLPVMRDIGSEWEAGRLSAAQEHLLSAALRNILGAMARLSAGERTPRRLLFATPTGDRHEFGILAAAMLAALGGLGVVYLGPDLPGEQIADAATRTGAQVVVLGLVYGASVPETMREVRSVAERLSAATELWLGGPVAPEDQTSLGRAHVVWLPDFVTLETHLARIGGRA